MRFRLAVLRSMMAFAIVLLLFVTEVLGASPASAILYGGGTWTINTWSPQVNGKGNVFAKAQTKVTSGSTPDKLGIVVCVVVWDGSDYFQLSTCVKDSASGVLQITRNKTIAGGCNHGVRYGTKARGWLSDEGVIYYGPGPGPGAFLFDPPSGGVQLC